MLAIPILFVKGDESYASLKQVLHHMISGTPGARCTLSHAWESMARAMLARQGPGTLKLATWTASQDG
jgi:hypothetical protein